MEAASSSTDNSSNKCFFGQLMSGHSIGSEVYCSEDYISLKEISHAEQRLILDRCCMYETNAGELDVIICSADVAYLGYEFLGRTSPHIRNKKCLFPLHKGSINHIPNLRKVSLEKCKTLYNEDKIWMPHEGSDE